MKTKNALVTNTAKRLLAAALALAMLPGVLSYQLVFAASDENSNAAADQAASANSAEETPQGITVWKDGKMQTIEAKAGESWAETEITGGDAPTLNARTVAEWTADQGTVTPKTGDNLYTLTAATGIKPGTNVEYFAVRYTVGTGSNAVAQTKYIFPKVHTLQATDEYIKSLKDTQTEQILDSITLKGFYSPGPRLKVRSKTRTYSVTNDEEVEAAKAEFLKEVSAITSEQRHYKEVTKEVDLSSTGVLGKRHSYLSSFNYKINENTLTNNALASWGVDEFLFTTDQPITEITGIEVFMSNGSWTVQGLTVSKVNKIGGYQEYGYYSGKYFLALEKEVICQLTKKKSGTLTLSANGDTLVNVGGEDSIYFALTKPAGMTISTGINDLYTIRMDFADVIDAGIETYLRNDANVKAPDAGTIYEDLAVEIEYKDKNGYIRNVTMPVILSILGQYKESGDTVNTIGLAQRGDTIAFTACLPDFSSLSNTKLYTGKAARDILKKNCGLDFLNESVIDSSVISDLDGDDISLAGLSIYKGTCRMSNTMDGTDVASNKKLKSYSYTFAFSEKDPSFYFTTTNSNGYKQRAKTSSNYSLSRYKAGDPIIATGLSGNFLIRIKTSDVANSATSGDVKIQVFYQDTDGNEKESSIYDLKTEVQKYLGYWPTTLNKKDNFAYAYGMSEGNYVEFPCQLDDIAAVTNIQITLDNLADEWQVSSISAAIIEGVGKRRVYAQDIAADSSQTTYRIIRPIVKDIIPPFPVDLSNLLFTPGDTYSLHTGTGTIIKADEVDFNKVRYSMTYEQASTLDLGYTKQRKIYDIGVKVADDPEANNVNGDSGSNNQFYFQLCFTNNGRSAFVLANQQLSADGFRAGQTEMFTIATNRDYGDLASVRIIPEDTSEDSEIFDKLNIEYITVTEQANGGTSMQYVIDNVGWIDIDYHDKSEENTSEGRAGRSINSLARSFQVSYKQNVIYLMCEIAADPWEVEEYDFSASVSCTIDYIDTDDQPQSISFDAVRRMYEYMKKTPVAYSAGYNNDPNASLYTNMGTVSDSNWMLRPNHKDRFMLPPLANVKRLVSMTFTGTNRTKGTAYWIISGLSVSRILSDSGIVSLATVGDGTEYLRKMKTDPHVEMVSDQKTHSLVLPSGSTQKIKIKLNEKDITWSENKTWVTAVERNPISSNDTLNIFVYPSKNSKDIDGTTLKIAAQYTMADSKGMQVRQDAMNTYGSGTDDAVFYYTGLTANNMQNLTSLWLSCRNSKILFNHAVVEQVRDNTVVGRYVINYGNTSATLGLRCAPSGTSTVDYPTKQTLMLSFGPQTKETNIIAPNEDNSNVNDIAVAFTYRSKLDHGESEYQSSYVYLGDVGISKLSPGMMIEVPFNVPYVDKITGVKIGEFGDITAELNGALALNYSYTSREYDETTGQYVTTGDQLTGTYSFDKTIKIPNSIYTLEKSADGMKGKGSVTPLTLDIKTADAEADKESGINSAVAAKIYYLDSKKASQVFEIEDLRTYIQADNDNKAFLTGKTATLKMMIPDCAEITDIEIIPSEESWTIESITGTLRLGADVVPVSRVIGETFTTDGMKISLRNVDLVTHVYREEDYLGIVTKHEKSIVADGGTIIVGVVRIDTGFDLAVQLISVATGKPSDMPEDSYTVDDEGFAFTLPKNNGSVAESYVITVISKENPNIKDVINVTVPVPEAEPQVVVIEGDGKEGKDGKDEDSETDEQEETDDSSNAEDDSSKEPQAEEAAASEDEPSGTQADEGAEQSQADNADEESGS